MRPELQNLVTRRAIENRKKLSNTEDFTQTLIFLHDRGYKVSPKSWLLYEVTAPSGTVIKNQTPREVIEIRKGID